MAGEEERVGVVTGASGGIGKEIARGLARAGWTAVMLARSEAKTRAAADDVRATVPGADVHVVLADLARLADVRRAAREIAERFPRLDALIHNAASIPHERRVTPDGLEEAFATNVLAPFVLTEALRASLERSKGRVVYFYGGGEPTFDIDDLQSERGAYDGWRAYVQSKNAVAILTRETARRLEGSGVTAIAALPGIVRTDGMRGLPGRMRIFSILMRPLMRTPEQGARTPLWLATTAGAGTPGRVHGSMFGDWKQEITRLPAAVSDPALAARLWDECARLAALSATPT